LWTQIALINGVHGNVPASLMTVHGSVLGRILVGAHQSSSFGVFPPSANMNPQQKMPPKQSKAQQQKKQNRVMTIANIKTPKAYWMGFSISGYA
jgi:hypothetical protein